TTPMNIRMPTTGPSRISTFRFIAPFSTPLDTVPPSLDAVRLRARAVGALRRDLAEAASRRRRGWRGRRAFQPLAIELSHVGDDRPPVRGRDRPPVPGHQPRPVRDDVEDLAVRVLQDLLLVEGGGGDVASLEQDPLAVPPRVVARLAVDRIPLPAALAKRLVDGHRDGRDELSVRSLAGEEGRVLFQPADRHRSRNGLPHGRAVVEKRAG